MKKSRKGLLTALMLMAVTVVFAQERIIQSEQLPKSAQSFVKAYYPQAKIAHIIEEKEFLSETEYKVVLSDGVKIEFDGKGNWIEVDAKRDAVPAKLIPAAISAHVKTSFPDNKIVKISKSARKYEVELTNGIDLEFNKNGKFIRIDD